jgi:hypothetical protein
MTDLHATAHSFRFPLCLSCSAHGQLPGRETPPDHPGRQRDGRSLPQGVRRGDARIVTLFNQRSDSAKIKDDVIRDLMIRAAYLVRLP